MAHGLMNAHADNATRSPLLISLRHQCECTGREVLTLSVVIDLNVPEEHFLWTMRQLRRDMQFEVEQHLTPRPSEPSPRRK